MGQDDGAPVATPANYVATQLLHDLAGISPQAIDSSPQLKQRLAAIQLDPRLGKLRLFERDGRIGFSFVPYE